MQTSHVSRRYLWLLLLVALLLFLLAAVQPETALGSTPRRDSTAQATESPSEKATNAAQVALGVWKEGATMPTRRSETAAAVIDGLIYVPGGFGGTDTLEVYDPAADNWKKLASMPEGRHHEMVTSAKGRLYVFGGGVSQDDWKPRDTTWAYDPAKDSWAVLAPMPEPRRAGAAVTLGDYIYIVGGFGGTQALLRYDPAKDTWTSLAAVHEQREHTSATVLDGKIYAVGGRWIEGGELTSVEIYDPATDQWTAGVPFNKGRGGLGLTVVGGKIYIVGGEILHFAAGTALKSTEVFDPKTQTWSAGPDLPAALHGVPVASVDGKLYVLGGSKVGGGVGNWGQVFIYQP